MITLITESHNYSEEAIKIYKSLGSVFTLKNIKKNRALEKSVLSQTNILVVRNLTQVDKKLIDSLPNLKVVASPTTGLNHIDVEYLKKKKIKLITLRGRKGFLKNITSTAEHTMALILSLYRHIPWSFDEVKRGKWPRDEFIGNQLKDKTIGILGYGRLGKIVRQYAKVFKMNIISHDPNVSSKKIEKDGVESVTMEDLFKRSDIVSIHVLLTTETYDLIKLKHLRLMKKNAILINTSRGELIEKNALLKALKDKWIKGAAIDVMHDEKKDGSHLKKDALYAYSKNNKNLLITSHLGGVSFEAMAATEDFIANLVKSWIKNTK